MNPKFADWYQLAHLQADHELLQRRWSGVESFVKALKPSSVYELARRFYGLPCRDADACSQFESALREADNAFTTTGREMEFTVLAGAALASTLEKSNPISIASALCLVVANCQGLRLAPIPDMVQDALQFLADESATLRNVGGAIAKTIEVPKDSIEGVVAAFNANTPQTASEPWTKVINSQIAQIRTLSSQVTLLDKRYHLLREESDILWWLTGESSRIASDAFSKLPAAIVPILIGRELAELTKQLPGPVAIEAFARRMLTRTQKEPEKSLQLTQSVNAVERSLRETWFQTHSTHAALDLCPILYACSSSLTVEGAKEWHPAFKTAQRMSATVKLTPLELARQTYLESLLLK